MTNVTSPVIQSSGDYVFYGCMASAVYSLYNVKTNEITSLPESPAGFLIAADGDYAYFAAQTWTRDANNNYTHTLIAFNIGTQTLRSHTNTSPGQELTFIGTHNDMAYFFTCADLFRYNPANNQLTRLARPNNIQVRADGWTTQRFRSVELRENRNGQMTLRWEIVGEFDERLEQITFTGSRRI